MSFVANTIKAAVRHPNRIIAPALAITGAAPLAVGLAAAGSTAIEGGNLKQSAMSGLFSYGGTALGDWATSKLIGNGINIPGASKLFLNNLEHPIYNYLPSLIVDNGIRTVGAALGENFHKSAFKSPELEMPAFPTLQNIRSELMPSFDELTRKAQEMVRKSTQMIMPHDSPKEIIDRLYLGEGRWNTSSQPNDDSVDEEDKTPSHGSPFQGLFRKTTPVVNSYNKQNFPPLKSLSKRTKIQRALTIARLSKG